MRLSPLVHLYVAENTAGTNPPNLSENALALTYLPSAAFGDGTHPTTRLCAGAVDLYCRLNRPETVLDVGTGTAVLARIARARGARFIVATDIDPIALSSAKSNTALDPTPVEILLSDALPDFWGPRFNLVIANILEGPLRMLAPALSRALAPGGTLFLSGFTPLQIPSLEIAFKEFGLKVENHSTLEGWALLQLKL
ncbi:MAG: 50S ribosomal protein L11 methyltransferase [Bdellovibrionia bacterium]